MSEESKSDMTRERSIFSEALQLASPEERAAFLERACGGDASLRAAVESLLKHHKDDHFMAKPGGTARLSPVTEKPGDMIGRYKLMEQIGEGGFGVVYVAEQREPVRRMVALKISKLGMDTRQVVARFEAERQALAMMDHPNIAKVLDGGATNSGRPYFVMELVRGIKVTEYCDQNKLTTRQRLDLFMQICRAVQHAHQKGVIHRDIKPSNILVTLHDGVPVPKVIDFGIAKATQGHLTDKTIYTEFQQFMGTPAYMSPEQAELSGLDIDTRSDLYSLGVLLYELLTGSPPFEEKALLECGLDEMRRTIREKEPPRPSTRLGDLTADALTTTARRHGTEPPKLLNLVRGDLDWIVMKCLEKDRSRRYESASGVAADIERHLNNEPIVARPPSTMYRLQKMVRRNKLAFGAGMAVGATVLAGLTVSTFLLIKVRQTLHREQLAKQELSQALDREQMAKEQKIQLLKEAEANAAKIKMNHAALYFSKAIDSIAQDDRIGALAYLAGTLSVNPTNEAAAIRLTTLLASQPWWVPTRELKQIGFNGSAEFSPDGKRILTASTNGTAQIWDAQNGQPLIGPLDHGTNEVYAEFSPDGKRILTVSVDGTLKLWDAQDGLLLIGPFKHGTNQFSRKFDIQAQFSSGGNMILTASDESVHVWNARTGRPLRNSLPLGDQLKSAQFDPDGNRILTTSVDDVVQVWDAETGHPLFGPLKHGTNEIHAQFSPDGRRILTTSDGGCAQFWDARNGTPMTESFKFASKAASVQFTPDGNRILATSSDDLTMHFWDAHNGQLLTEPLKQDVWLEEALFSPDGKQIITFTGWFPLAFMQVRDAQSGQAITGPLTGIGPSLIWPFTGGAFGHSGFSPNGMRMLTSSSNDTVLVWDEVGGQPLAETLQQDGGAGGGQSGHPLTEHLTLGTTEEVADVAPDHKHILTTGWVRTNDTPREWLRVWDAQGGQPLTVQLEHVNNLSSAQFSPDGKRILTVDGDNTGRVWDAQNGQPLSGTWKFGTNVSSAQFSPDGKRLLTVSDEYAQVWDAQNGQALTEPLKHSGGLKSAQFNAGGNRILTVSDKSTRMWNAQSGQPLIDVLHHGFELDDAKFSPDGKCLATVSELGTRVWDAQTGQPLTDLLYTFGTESADFSPDGKRIVTAGFGKVALVWDAHSGQPLSEPFKCKGGGSLQSAQFSPDGTRIYMHSDDNLIWDIAPSTGSFPAWLPRLAEAISGQVLSEQGLLEPFRLDRAETINQIQQQLNHEPDDDGWVHWGRWFLGDPAARTISPFSKITVPEYIETLITKNTDESLAEAESLAIGNRELMQRITMAGRQHIERLITEYTEESLAEAERLAVGNGELLKRITVARQHPIFRIKQAIARQTNAEAVFREFAREGTPDEIEEWFRKALDHKDLNSIAWELATANDPNSREGTLAVMLAEKAVANCNRNDPLIVDTLAAAYAETGQFDKAVKTQWEAITLLQQHTHDKDSYIARLRIYEAKTPYHQPTNHTAQ